MRKIGKKLLSLALALVMVLGVAPAAAWAAEPGDTVMTFTDETGFTYVLELSNPIIKVDTHENGLPIYYVPEGTRFTSMDGFAPDDGLCHAYSFGNASAGAHLLKIMCRHYYGPSADTVKQNEVELSFYLYHAEPEQPEKTVYEADVTIAGKANRKARITLDYNWFTQSSSTYNHELGIFSIAMSSTVYHDKTCTSLSKAIASFGFEDVRAYDEASNFENWTGDGRVGHVVAHRTLTLNGKKTTVVAVVIRGTLGGAEWASNFLDSGMADGASGFDDAAETVVKNTHAYINNLENPGEIKVLVTGHSRGAVVANIVAASLSSGTVFPQDTKSYGTYNVFAYTFASPLLSPTTANKAYCPNIFNIIYPKDLVTKVPPQILGGLPRYGINLYLPIKSAFNCKAAGMSYDQFSGAMRNYYYNFTEKTYYTIDVDPVCWHESASYFSWMKKYTGEELFGSLNGKTYPAYKRLTTACPVDVYVYDTDGTLLASVVNEKIEADTLEVLVEDGVKTIDIPEGMEYDLRIVARDNGAVNYTVSEMALCDLGETATRTVGFDEISIEKGDVITGTINDKTGTPASNYDLTKTSVDGTKTSIVHSSDNLQSAPANFTDVKSSDYYYDAVYWAVSKQITNGTSPTTFSPNDTCTQGHILTFLWRAKGEPAPAGTVRGTEYYTKAMQWAKEKGLTAAGLSPHADCTRADVVTYLWKLAGSPNIKAASFTDVDPDAACAQAVAWAVEQKITTGTSAATFSPDDTCTRGQIVTFLYRAYK